MTSAAISDLASAAAIYSQRDFCFSDHTLESIFLTHKDALQNYMMHATCKSTRYGLAPKATMRLKSCRTYISTLSNVICEGSEFAVPISEILFESTEEQFIREQHLTFDKVKRSRKSGRLNIYQPAFRKLFEWLKHEAMKAGCGCDGCMRTCQLLLTPEKQAEDQRSFCRNCGCGQHYTVVGTCSRTCHLMDSRTGRMTCLGRRQCMNCLRYFPNCRFHRMVEVIKKKPEIKESVAAGRLFICNFCFVNKTVQEKWYLEVRKPLEVGLVRLERGIHQIASKEISERKLLKEMREEACSSIRVNKEDLLTHRQVAGLMQTADENIEKITAHLEDKKMTSAKGFLNCLDDVLSKMCTQQPMERKDRDLILAAARYHIGNNDASLNTDENGTVYVRRKRRKKNPQQDSI